MQKVITINLNGNAYQLDEPGYDALHRYFEDAGTRLAGNLDRAEILSDLELAVAERCLRILRSGKTVISSVEIEQILGEIGPVDRGGGSAVPPGDAGEPKEGSGVRHLYQISEGAMISGVCNGLAAYFNIDPSFIRVGFVLLALLHGIGVAVYLLLMVLVPYAKTSEERASAHGRNIGLPYRVQKFVEGFRHKVMEMSWWRRKREVKL